MIGWLKKERLYMIGWLNKINKMAGCYWLANADLTSLSRVLSRALGQYYPRASKQNTKWLSLGWHGCYGWLWLLWLAMAAMAMAKTQKNIYSRVYYNEETKDTLN